MRPDHPPDSDPRDRILDAAEEHFAFHGFAGARVAAIAEQAQVNKAMLYYYWGDKEALYQAVLRRVFDGVVTTAQTSLDDVSLPVETRLRSFLGGYSTILARHPLFLRIMMRELLDGGQRLPGLLPPNLPLQARHFAEVFIQGQVDGQLNPSVDPRLAIMATIAPFVLFNVARPLAGAILHTDIGELRDTYEQSVLSILFDGLRVRTETERPS